MTCPACARAIVGASDEFRAGCRGCQARALARSDAMAAVMDEARTRDERLQARADLREAIRVTMPGVGADEARSAVLSWWTVEKAERMPT